MISWRKKKQKFSPFFFIGLSFALTFQQSVTHFMFKKTFFFFLLVSLIYFFTKFVFFDRPLTAGDHLNDVWQPASNKRLVGSKSSVIFFRLPAILNVFFKNKFFNLLNLNITHLLRILMFRDLNFKMTFKQGYTL